MRTKGTEIFIVRGDSGFLQIYMSDREDNKILFKAGDVLFLTVKSSSRTSKISFQKIVEIQTETDFVSVNIEPNDTKELSFGQYVYDIQLTRSNGDVHTIMMPSKFTIGDEITYD